MKNILHQPNVLMIIYFKKNILRFFNDLVKISKLNASKVFTSDRETILPLLRCFEFQKILLVNVEPMKNFLLFLLATLIVDLRRKREWIFFTMIQQHMVFQFLYIQIIWNSQFAVIKKKISSLLILGHIFNSIIWV